MSETSYATYPVNTTLQQFNLIIIGADLAILTCLNTLLENRYNFNLTGILRENTDEESWQILTDAHLICVDVNVKSTVEHRLFSFRNNLIYFDSSDMDNFSRSLDEYTHQVFIENEAVKTSLPAEVSLEDQKEVTNIHIDKSFSTKYGLTQRETLTLFYLINGYSYKMIAAEMFVSINTVRSHIKQVYFKLKINCSAQAIVKVIQESSS